MNGARNQERKDERKANRRGAARLAAVQALYQMDIAGTDLNDILAEFESHWLGGEVEGEKYLPADAALFRDIVRGVVADQRKLDPVIDHALDKGWPLKRVEALVRAVLRAGAFDVTPVHLGGARRGGVPAQDRRLGAAVGGRRSVQQEGERGREPR